MVHRRFILTGGLAVLSTGLARAQTPAPPEQALAPADKRPSFRLEEAAHFDHQATGVAVSADGRVFVNFPRWTEDSPISVAEVGRDGSLKPIPTKPGIRGAMPAAPRRRRVTTSCACSLS